jgi:hypothetical protein
VNDVERRLSHARDTGDIELYLRVLAAAPLYLPGFLPSGTDDTRQRLLTRMRGGTRYLVVFTSVEALATAAGDTADGWRVTSLAELVGGVLDPAWGVLIAPIGLHLAPATVHELANATESVTRAGTAAGRRIGPTAGRRDGFDPRLPFQPADEAERLLHAALAVPSPAEFLDVLVVSAVLVPAREPAPPAREPAPPAREPAPPAREPAPPAREPPPPRTSAPPREPPSAREPAPSRALGPDFPWRVEPVDGAPTISVFTSTLRLAEALPGPVPTVRADFLAVARAWPDPAYRLTVNPGSSIAVTFPGDQVADLIEWSRSLVARELRRRGGWNGGSSAQRRR